MKRTAILIALLCTSFSFGPVPTAAQGTTARGKSGAVASVDVRATQIGIDVLKAGGNALDAAVATAAALGVTDPFSCGVGGGGFMVIYLKDSGKVITIDAREEAPASAHPDMFKDPDSAKGDPLPFSPNRISNGVAVGVPGTVRGWEIALKDYGTKSLAEMLAPAIKLAEAGFEVDRTFNEQIGSNRDRFGVFTSTAALYLSGGRIPAVGSIFKNPDLANTYKMIAEKGADAFYKGEIAQAIVNTVQKPPTIRNPVFRVLPGGMTLADLEKYGAHVQAPVSIDYRGYKLYGMGLPSSGGITTFETLNLLEGYDMANLDRAKAWNYVIEAMRLAYADRGAFIGDARFVNVPIMGLLSKDYANERRALIGDRAMAGGNAARAKAGDPAKYQGSGISVQLLTEPSENTESVSTTHLTVADAKGNVVSYTFTIEAIGGSGMVVPGYGFLLNNELTDFDIGPTHPNRPEAGKRPRSSMAPTIAIAPDGRVLAFGSPGGAAIITTVISITVNMIDFGMPIDEAIAAPRLSQRNGGTTQVDGGLERSAVGRALTQLGHIFAPIAELGAATGIVIESDGTMHAAAEPVRRGGGSAMVVEPAN